MDSRDIASLIPPLNLQRTKPIPILPKPGVQYENALISYIRGRIIPRIMKRSYHTGCRISDIKLIESDFKVTLTFQFSKVTKVEKKEEI